MNRTRITRSAALGLALTALAAPTAVAQQQDLRSPDARDAAAAAEAQQRQDLRSPDTRDAAQGRGTFSAPEVTVVKMPESSPQGGGLDWGDAGIGAAGMLGLVLLAIGGTLAIVHRRGGAVQRSETPTAA
ncbi:MAG TPA: hypothetical protein VGF25_18755 [Thermoleophilaceae bacterium]|jgi:hypothetical protein